MIEYFDSAASIAWHGLMAFVWICVGWYLAGRPKPKRQRQRRQLRAASDRRAVDSKGSRCEPPPADQDVAIRILMDCSNDPDFAIPIAEGTMEPINEVQLMGTYRYDASRRTYVRQDGGTRLTEVPESDVAGWRSVNQPKLTGGDAIPDFVARAIGLNGSS